MNGLSGEVILACSYSGFLVVVSLLLEAAAKRVHHRSSLYRLKGFTFHERKDAWICPKGEYLHRIGDDVRRKLVRYRAEASKCNRCALKPSCTSSHHGREVAHSTEDWLESETGRFHRVISLVLVVLALFIVAVVWIRHQDGEEFGLLGGTFTLLTGVAAILSARLMKGTTRASRYGADT